MCGINIKKRLPGVTEPSYSKKELSLSVNILTGIIQLVPVFE